MLNICFCGNRPILQGMLMGMLSLSMHTSEEICFYILTGDITYKGLSHTQITESDCEFLNKQVRKQNPLTSVKLIDATDIFLKEFDKGANINNMYTPFAFIRLLMDLIPDLPDRILYLDCDVIVNKDLKDFYYMDLQGNDLAMVHDCMREPHYTNSGVILFDLKAIREDKTFVKARDIVNNIKLFMPDQDAINMVFKGKMLLINRKFNEQRKLTDQTVIRHYCQSIRFVPYFHIIKTKPWKEDFNQVYKDETYPELFKAYNDALKDLPPSYQIKKEKKKLIKIKI